MEWLGTQKTLGSKPSLRKGHSMTRLLDSSLILVFGGENSRGEALNDMWSFHVERMEWRLIRYKDGPVPSPRILHSATAISSTAMVVMFGDSAARGSPTKPRPSRDVWAFDIRDHSWREIKEGNEHIPARSCHTAVFGNGLGQVPAIYVFGGFGSGETLHSAVYRLRIRDWQWECLPIVVNDVSGKELVVPGTELHPDAPAAWQKSFPSQRESHVALWLPGLNGMMIYGGDGGVALLNDTWLFVPSSRRAGTWKWRKLELQAARGKSENKLPVCAGSSLIALPTEKTQVLMWGGILHSEEMLSPSTFYLMDFDAMQTTRLIAQGTPPANGRILHGLVRAGSNVYLFGGCDGMGHVKEGLEIAKLLPNFKSIGSRATDFGPEAAGVAAGGKAARHRQEYALGMKGDSEEPDPNMPLMGPSSIPKGTPLSGRIIESTDYGYFVSVIINGKLYKGVLVANPLKNDESTLTKERETPKPQQAAKEEPTQSGNTEASARKRQRLDPIAAQLPDSPQKRVIVPKDEVIAID